MSGTLVYNAHGRPVISCRIPFFSWKPQKLNGPSEDSYDDEYDLERNLCDAPCTLYFARYPDPLGMVWANNAYLDVTGRQPRESIMRPPHN